MIPPRGIACKAGRAPGAPIRLHLAPMHPGDRLGPIPDGATCTACGASVPAEWIRILAHRDDGAFVELDCTGCGSRALVAGDVAADPMAISAANVAAMRDCLADWHGDLRGLLADGR